MTDRPNRVLYSHDCLDVLRDELALPSGSVDLIYLDPPFNSKNQYNLPFKGKDKTARPVEAFNDTWTWGDKEEGLLQQLDSGPSTHRLADIVRLAQIIDEGNRRLSLAAYLLNMAVRLMPMRRVLSEKGSIYLHCDQTASHYLKLLMDAIFGMGNFRNEIVWNYRRWPAKTPQWQKMHDTIFWYSKSDKWTWNQQYEELSESSKKMWRGKRRIDVVDPETGRRHSIVAEGKSQGVPMRSVWDISVVHPAAKEKLGYPTQKPLTLLKRIIEASSNPGDLVLDPFCGCGTTVHAAEELGRRWVGIDISSFSVGLMQERILNNFPVLTANDILSIGVPTNVGEAKALAARDKFEFEKWACGAIGAEGMFHDPGTPGADGGVDGVLKFYPIPVSANVNAGKKGITVKPEYAIVQVKGGSVTPDAVRALKTTVDQFGAKAGIMVCFNEYMGTVENQRVKATFRDAVGEYPVIQGLSVERLLDNERPDLPLYGRQRQGGLLSALA